MPRNQKEIKQVLKCGQEILSSRPELLEYDVESIIDELDDGTEEMMHNRWGVAAYVIVNSIKDFQLPALVKQLAQLHPTNRDVLAFEYAGYILQQDYNIVLERLLIEAQKQGGFKKILDYVVHNLAYIKSVEVEYIIPFLDVLEEYPTERSRIIYRYAEGIANSEAFSQAVETIGEIQNQTQVEFISNILRRWFVHDSISGIEALRQLSKQSTTWGKQAYLDAVDQSQWVSGVLEEHFSIIEQLFEEEAIFWRKGIAILTHALLENTVHELLRNQVLSYLKHLPDSSDEEKKIFLETLSWQEKIPDDLTRIFLSVIERPFENGECPLGTLDNILSCYGKQYGWKKLTEQLHLVFQVNGYRENQDNFFGDIHQVMSVLRENMEEVIQNALEDLLSNDINRVYFSVGLLTEGSLGNQLTLPARMDKKIYSEIQLSRMLKILMYFSADGKKVCHGAFQLLTMTEEEPENYIKVCWEDIYENYPHTFYEVAKTYSESDYVGQKELAKEVISRYEADSKEQESLCIIRDFLPTIEQHRIYANAQNRQRNQIQRSSRKNFIFAELFPARVLKYGTANAHIVKGTKGEKIFQSSGYHRFEYSMELPKLYVIDPVGFYMRKKQILQEVAEHAIDP